MREDVSANRSQMRPSPSQSMCGLHVVPDGRDYAVSTTYTYAHTGTEERNDVEIEEGIIYNMEYSI